jgi:C1A family cysteine protease
MKFACTLVVLATLAFLSQAESEAALRVRFERFKQDFGKSYGTKQLEAYRFSIFTSNLERAAKLNDEEGNQVYGVTKFSDLTREEFTAQYLGYKPSFGQAAIDRLAMPVLQSTATANSLNAPNTTDFDWRKLGAVTRVKDQGQCGSCWAFSAVEEMESAWFLAGHPLTELSPQQVVSCDKKGKDEGCNGGDTVTAYVYMKQAGLEADKDYPYKSGESGDDGPCRYSQAKVAAKMTNWTYAVTPCFSSCKNQDENTLAANLAQTGPASICVVAGDNWQLYSGGILSKNCPSAYGSLDHCVQLVGYSTNASGVKYWLVRNSWGTDWGNQGYIWIKFGSNLCGLADEATFVQI